MDILLPTAVLPLGPNPERNSSCGSRTAGDVGGEIPSVKMQRVDADTGLFWLTEPDMVRPISIQEQFILYEQTSSKSGSRCLLTTHTVEFSKS